MGDEVDVQVEFVSSCCNKTEAGVARSSQVDSNMLFVRNRSHINASRALLSRYYVQATHTRPIPATSTTPVEKILLDTIKVRRLLHFFELPV